MANPSFNAPEALKLILDGFSVHKGDRGELLTLLLLTLARDATVVEAATHLITPSDARSRILAIPDFFGNLLKCTAKPTKIVRQFIDEFKGCFMHFNHFIKVHEWALLRQDYLLGYMARGAAVLCANNQPGVDIVLMGMHGTRAHTSNLIPILVQTKNDATYTAQPDDALFDAMDPYALKIWDHVTAKTTKPVIRIVFALAVQREDARLTVVKKTKTSVINGVEAKFEAYDFWVAGLASGVLTPIPPQAEDLWDALLQASYGWNEPYKGLNARPKALRRSMNAGGGTHPDHWDSWVLPRSASHDIATKTKGKGQTDSEDVFGLKNPNPSVPPPARSSASTEQASRSRNTGTR
ncbi:uncharacterized protein B0H18DRAFT_1125192 [Fomitopsis serialis]|uniref:uncharacterized protein n=1 Tax=Fomitopsis serialis TaxID=139415 RepID=UPI002008C587|nr:uncharacterized protein B0H18DRAFT_1125192 [Neoantrodia serialis]KAH9914977.1 hypothetical protein B0H18DRAFT_1125192 [Neoantrodia serialis]